MAPARVAVVVSRFPKFTETFVIGEILAFRRLGVDVEIHPLLPRQPPPHQPEAIAMLDGAHFASPRGRRALVALAATAVTKPIVLAKIMVLSISQCAVRPTFLAKHLFLLPRICLMARELRAQGVTHVHAHFATQAGFAAWAVGRLTGIPYSIVAHGSDIHRHQVMLPLKVREAAFIATVSEYNRAVIVGACGPGAASKVHVVRLGIDLSAIAPAPEVPRPVASPATLLCVGTLHEVKGQRHAIEAVALLAARGHDVRLDLIGDGPDRTALEALVSARSLTEIVRLVGSLAHAEVLERYRHCDLVVVPSIESRDGRKEGLPTVIVEAMACGAPVIASDLAGIGEIVDHERTGLLVPPGDAEALADAAQRLLTYPRLRALTTESARALVQADYDRDTNARRMLELMGDASTAVRWTGGSSR